MFLELTTGLLPQDHRVYSRYVWMWPQWVMSGQCTRVKCQPFPRCVHCTTEQSSLQCNAQSSEIHIEQIYFMIYVAFGFCSKCLHNLCFSYALMLSWSLIHWGLTKSNGVSQGTASARTASFPLLCSNGRGTLSRRARVQDRGSTEVLARPVLMHSPHLGPPFLLYPLDPGDYHRFPPVCGQTHGGNL